MHLFAFQENIPIFALAKADCMKKMTKEELLKAIKKAKEHKEQALKQTAKEWKRMGIKGKVVLI